MYNGVMDNVGSIRNMRKDLFSKKMKSSSQRVNATPNHGIVKERKNKFVKPPQSISPMDKRNIRISKLPSDSNNEYYINFLNSLKKDIGNADNGLSGNSKGANMTTFFKKKCNSYSKDDNNNNNNNKPIKLKLSTNSNGNNYASGTDADSQTSPNCKGRKKNGQGQKKKTKGEMTISPEWNKNKINQVVCYSTSNINNNNNVNTNEMGDGGKDNVKIKIKNKKKIFGCLTLCSPSA